MTVGAPGSAVEDSSKRGEDYVSPVENGALIEMRKAEEGCGRKQAASRAEASFEQVLQDSAKVPTMAAPAVSGAGIAR